MLIWLCSKKAHDDYGVKTQLNLFYNTSSWYGADEFSLAEMTDAYKAEFKASSSWLKLAFHAKEEWPDYPYVNADYELVHRDFNLIKNEVIRFAGEDSFAYNVVPHWAPISKEGVLALRDNGVKTPTRPTAKSRNGTATNLFCLTATLSV